jgi:hypothetical protein
MYGDGNFTTIKNQDYSRSRRAGLWLFCPVFIDVVDLIAVIAISLLGKKACSLDANPMNEEFSGGNIITR